MKDEEEGHSRVDPLRNGFLVEDVANDEGAKEEEVQNVDHRWNPVTEVNEVNDVI